LPPQGPSCSAGYISAFECSVSGVLCPVSGVWCLVSGVRCPLLKTLRHLNLSLSTDSLPKWAHLVMLCVPVDALRNASRTPNSSLHSSPSTSTCGSCLCRSCAALRPCIPHRTGSTTKSGLQSKGGEGSRSSRRKLSRAAAAAAVSSK